MLLVRRTAEWVMKLLSKSIVGERKTKHTTASALMLAGFAGFAGCKFLARWHA